MFVGLVLSPLVLTCTIKYEHTLSGAVGDVEIYSDVRGCDAAFDDCEVEKNVSFTHNNRLISETYLQLCETKIDTLCIVFLYRSEGGTAPLPLLPCSLSTGLVV